MTFATGNNMAAGAGANLRELMDRMGHSTARAAMVYLHGSDERQQVIADALSKLAAAELEQSRKRESGTQRARRRKRASQVRRTNVAYLRSDLGVCTERARQDSNLRPTA